MIIGGYLDLRDIQAGIRCTLAPTTEMIIATIATGEDTEPWAATAYF
jgi:hypothetical protein